MKALFFCGFMIIASISCSEKDAPKHCPDDPVCFITIFPNPTESDATLTFKSDVPFQDTVKIHQINGELVSFQLVDAVQGENEVFISLSDLAPNIYIVELAYSDSDFFTKIIKK